MKVMMMTPKVDLDDDIFGFTNRWINEFAKKLGRLHVVTLNSGRTDLSSNVELYPLSKKKTKVSKFFLLQDYLSKIIPKVDVVFTHMFPDFPLFVAPYSKLFDKPIIMWRTHGHIDLRSKISHALVDRIVTASRRGFRINSEKIRVVGHGIDTELFRPAPEKTEENLILSVGRISPVKNYETLIQAVDLMNEEVKVEIVGGPLGKEGRRYKKKLEKQAKTVDNAKIDFVGEVLHKEIVDYYNRCKVFVNTSRTGGLDKVVLEAMSCGKPVVTCNDAFLDIFDEEMKNKYFFEEGNEIELADKIFKFVKEDKRDSKRELRDIVVKNNSIFSLADKMYRIWREAQK